MHNSRRFTLFAFVGCLGLYAEGLSRADDPVALREVFAVRCEYHVSCRVELSGSLSLPAEKGQSISRPLSVTGNSNIEYDEKILDPGRNGQGEKTVRIYRRIEFQRKVGDRPQESTIRNQVRRLVVLRHQNREVPFSPDGPLTWAEIDLVRTDVFTPALVGMLPARAVRPGDRWTAGSAAIQELTDMDRIDEGQVECRFEQVTTLANRRHARVSLSGTVRGLNEDGPNKQQLEGYFFFDLESNHLSYLSLKGVSSMLDKDGKILGSVGGVFVLTRQAHQRAQDLTDEVLGKISLEPNADNTQLLYENPDMRIRFLYPRRWHVAAGNGSQIALDEPAGSGLLLTVEPLSRVPTAAQFLAETRNYLQQQKATIKRIDSPRRLQGSPHPIDEFAFHAEVMGQRVFMNYFVIREASGGAVVTARLLPDNLTNLQKEVEQIVRSVQIGAAK
jgi:hypothetical protein